MTPLVTSRTYIDPSRCPVRNEEKKNTSGKQPPVMSQRVLQPPNGVSSAPLTLVQGAIGLIMLLLRLLEKEEVEEVERDVEEVEKDNEDLAEDVGETVGVVEE